MTDSKAPDAAYLVSTTEYARLNSKAPSSVRHMILRGSLSTAVQIGKCWFVDKREPYPDHRVTTGEYKDWRKPKP